MPPETDLQFQDERSRRKATTASLFERIVATADPEARDVLVGEVIAVNMNLAKSIASRYRNRGIDRDDLEQVAYVGLVKAANGFSPDKGEDFLVYALPTIRGEIQRHFRDHGWTVRIPRRLQATQALLSRAAQGGELTGAKRPADLAAELDLPLAEVEEALAAQGCFSPVSLDAEFEAGGASIGDLLGTDDDKDAAEARAIVHQAVSRLSERDRRIVWMRFFEDRSQADIGRELGVTQMQVSRLLTRILRDLRRVAGESADAVAAAVAPVEAHDSLQAGRPVIAEVAVA